MFYNIVHLLTELHQRSCLSSSSDVLPLTSSSLAQNAKLSNKSDCFDAKSKGKVKSFSDYKKMKGSEWKKKVDKGKSKYEDVVIFIGLLQWNQEERKLKAKRGKKLLSKFQIKHLTLKCGQKALKSGKLITVMISSNRKNILWFIQMVKKLCFCLTQRSSFQQNDTGKRVGKIKNALLCMPAVMM